MTSNDEKELTVAKVLTVLNNCKKYPYDEYSDHNKAIEECMDAFRTMKRYYRKEGRTKNSRCFVYYIHNRNGRKVKIGISTRPSARLGQLQTSSAERMEIVNTIEFSCTENAHMAEQALHKRFMKYRVKTDNMCKHTEWFDDAILDELLTNFKTYDDVVEKCGLQDAFSHYKNPTNDEKKKVAASAITLRKRDETKSIPKDDTVTELFLINGMYHAYGGI